MYKAPVSCITCSIFKQQTYPGLIHPPGGRNWQLIDPNKEGTKWAPVFIWQLTKCQVDTKTWHQTEEQQCKPLFRCQVFLSTWHLVKRLNLTRPNFYLPVLLWLLVLLVAATKHWQFKQPTCLLGRPGCLICARY